MVLGVEGLWGGGVEPGWPGMVRGQLGHGAVEVEEPGLEIGARAPVRVLPLSLAFGGPLGLFP